MQSRTRLLLLVAIVLSVLALVACGSDPTATPNATATQPAASTGTPNATPGPNDDFQAQWDALIQAAKAEGDLVWVAGGSAGRAYRPIADHFQQKFGINVTLSQGSGTQQTERVLNEQANGQYLVDILMIGETSAQELLAQDGIVDVNPLLFHPDAIDESKWYKGKLWFTDPDQKYQINTGANATPENLSMRYNTNLVTDADIEGWTSIFDFLDPKWKGKIVAIPPTTGGAGGSYYAIMVNSNYDGEAFLRELFDPELEVDFIEDFRLIRDGVAQGKYAFGILIGSGGEDIDRLGDEGAPVARLNKPLEEGYTLTGAGSASQVSVAAKAPNPNAAKLFLNWWLTQEAQTLRHTISEGDVDPTLREDVECFNQPSTDDIECREPGRDYPYLTADPELTSQREQANDRAIEIYQEVRGQ